MEINGLGDPGQCLGLLIASRQCRFLVWKTKIRLTDRRATQARLRRALSEGMIAVGGNDGVS